MRISPRISRVFDHTDRPSTGLAAIAQGSNARSAFFVSFSLTRPQIVDVQGTRLGRDVGPQKQARFIGGHAHWTRQIGRVHDPANGHRLHHHHGGAFDDPRQWTRSGRDPSQLTTCDLWHEHDHVRRSSVHLVHIGGTCSHSQVRGTRAYIEPFTKASLRRRG